MGQGKRQENDLSDRSGQKRKEAEKRANGRTHVKGGSLKNNAETTRKKHKKMKGEVLSEPKEGTRGSGEDDGKEILRKARGEGPGESGSKKMGIDDFKRNAKRKKRIYVNLQQGVEGGKGTKNITAGDKRAVEKGQPDSIVSRTRHNTG